MNTQITQVFLTDESFIRSLGVEDNLSSNYIYRALSEAQNIKLHEILGSNLLSSLKHKVQAQTTIVEPYKGLLEIIQYYLDYQTLALIPMLVHYKVANAGIVKASDDNLQSSTFKEVDSIIKYNQERADFYAKEIQMYCLKNHTQIPELSESDTYAIKSNLYSSATCGLWLGGPRNPNRRYRGEGSIRATFTKFDR